MSEDPKSPPNKDAIAELRIYAQEIRDMINHENELEHHRMQWFALLTGLLFTTLALLWENWTESWPILLIVCAMGFLVTLSCSNAVLSAQKARRRLEADYAARVAAEGQDVEGIVSHVARVKALKGNLIGKILGVRYMVFWVFAIGWLLVAIFVLLTRCGCLPAELSPIE
ncbi:MAG: hypothetical protein AAF585_00990 [Verrucomicrobiota bacterium]